MGSAQKSGAVKARGRARALLAERVAARHAADKANEQDLTEFLRLQAELDAIEARHESAVAAAKDAYLTAVARASEEHGRSTERARVAQAQCIRNLKDRGERVADIAMLTGLSGIEIGRLTRRSESDGAHTETAAENLGGVAREEVDRDSDIVLGSDVAGKRDPHIDRENGVAHPW